MALEKVFFDPPTLKRFGEGPLRARLVDDYNALCKYPYCAHSIIPGRRKKSFQA